MSIRAICCAAVLTGIATSANAADLRGQPYTVNQPLNAYSWAGPYIGGNIGYNFGDINNSAVRPSGFSGGVQAGYNFQSGPWVFGIEGDLQGNAANDRFAVWKFSNPWFGTLRGRGGYAVNNVLFYGTAGLAFGSVRAETIAGITETKTAAGWTIGAGAEFGITQNWTAKVEYLYVDLSDNRFITTGSTHGYQSSLVRVGVNYRF